MNADQLVLFVLGPPATLQVARVSTGKAETLARDIGRSLQRIPGGRLVSFVMREAPSAGGAPGSDYWVNALNPQTGAITALTKTAPGSTDRDTAWLPDGTLLMSAGPKIFAWKAGDKAWREGYSLRSAGKLAGLTRMACAQRQGRRRRPHGTTEDTEDTEIGALFPVCPQAGTAWPAPGVSGTHGAGRVHETGVNARASLMGAGTNLAPARQPWTVLSPISASPSAP